MSAGRIEVVRSDADQPWHYRVVDAEGRVLVVSENYARKVGAERGIIALAEALSLPSAGLEVQENGTTLLITEDDGWGPETTVSYLDERTETPS